MQNRAEQLLDIPGVDKVSMIVRTHHDRYEELKDFADENSSRVEIVTEAAVGPRGPGRGPEELPECDAVKPRAPCSRSR